MSGGVGEGQIKVSIHARYLSFYLFYIEILTNRQLQYLQLLFQTLTSIPNPPSQGIKHSTNSLT
jgi:hypothetical protein